MSHVVATTGRGTGRTSRMLEALPADKPVTVVVHTQAMAEYVRNLAVKLRPDLKHPIRVRVVRDTCDCDYLRGCDYVVDHAMLELASSPVFTLLRMFDRKHRRDLTKWESNQ